MAHDPRHTGSIVITGASTGIGRACALRLDRMGFRVFAGVRRPQDGEALQAEASDRLVALRVDVADESSVRAARDTVTQAVGRDGLRGLVNNAGIVVSGPLETLPPDELRRQLEVNLLGAFRTTQALLDLIRLGRGRIVNMSSIAGRLASPFTGPYSMSKFALEAYTDALRMELDPWGIHVAAVEPGSIATPIWEKSRRSGEESYEMLGEKGRALYGAQMQALRDASVKIASKGIPADRVAEAVAHALTSPRPRTRYFVGTDAKALRLLARWLPDRLRDRLILRGMGVAGIRPQGEA